MSYKVKPHKAVVKRFKVTKTGKLKYRREKNTHLMSGRPAKLKRKVSRPQVLYEGMARNLREMAGISHLQPAKAAHERRLAEAGKLDKSAADSE